MSPAPQRVVVLGSGGLEGKSATAFLLRRGFQNLVLADAKEHEVPPGCVGSFGPTYLDALVKADVIVRSPGVKTSLSELRAASNLGATVTSGTRLLLEGCPALDVAPCPAQVAAVTGSNGKTTCTSLLHAAATAAWERESRPGRVWLGGNIGTPVLDLVDEVQPDDLVILELSSFQLQDLVRSPWLGVVLNVTPNHLDWHPDFNDYTQAKRRVFDQPGNTWAVLSATDAVTKCWATERATGVRTFDDRVLEVGDASTFVHLAPCDADGAPVPVRVPLEDLRFKTHPETIAAAAQAAVLLGASADDVASALRSFTGAEHRLQSIRTLDGVDYVDDSANTTPDSAIVALRAFPPSSVVILLGGSDKGTPFEALAREVVARQARVVLLGQVAPQIAAAIRAVDPGYPVAFRPAFQTDFEAVVAEARALARPGDHVLLSTGCASFGMFQNYTHRAAEFARIVGGWEPAR